MTRHRKETKLMKKFVTIIATLLIIMTMACGCEAIDIGVNTPTKAPTQTQAPAPTGTANETPAPTGTTETGTPTAKVDATPAPTGSVEAPTNTPVPTEAPTVAPTSTPAPTEAPTVAPTNTPVPTETPTPVPDVWVYQDDIYNLFSSPNIDTREREYWQAAVNDIMKFDAYEAYRDYLVGTTEGILITGYTGDAEEIVFPTEIDGKPVIAVFMKHSNTTVKSVVVPEGIKLVAFTYRFESLESIEIAASVQIMEGIINDNTHRVVVKGSDRVYTPDDVKGKTAVEIGSNYRVCSLNLNHGYTSLEALDELVLPGDITELMFQVKHYCSWVIQAIAKGKRGDIVYTTFDIPENSYAFNCIKGELTHANMAIESRVEIGSVLGSTERAEINFVYDMQFDGHTLKGLGDSYRYLIRQEGSDYDFSEKKLIAEGGENYKDATKRPAIMFGPEGLYIERKWIYDEATGNTVEKELDTEAIVIYKYGDELVYNSKNGRAYKTTKYTFKSWFDEKAYEHITYVALGENGNPHIYGLSAIASPVEELLIRQGVISKDTKLEVEYDDSLPKLREIISEPKHDYRYEYEVKINLDEIDNDFWIQSYMSWFEAADFHEYDYDKSNKLLEKLERQQR